MSLPKPTRRGRKTGDRMKFRPNGHHNLFADARRINAIVWLDQRLGRHFTIKGTRRVYGDLMRCEYCAEVFVFQPRKGTNVKGRFCSHKCLYRSTTNPSIRRVLKSGRVDESALDGLFSEWVRSVGHCEASGSGSFQCAGRLECCHIVSRIYRGTRWDRTNAICMCAAHHKFYTHRPIEWRDFIAQKYGVGYMEALEAKARPITKLDPVTRFELWTSMRAVVSALRKDDEELVIVEVRG